MLYVSVIGLLGALVLHGLLWSLVIRFEPENRVLAYLLAIPILGSIITFFSLPGIESPHFIAAGCLLFLAIASIMNLQHLSEWTMEVWRVFKSTSIWQRLILVFPLSGLLFATLPLSRPDTWTYHLNVSKILMNQGTLKFPVLNDHIHFAGAYEYLFLVPRLFFTSDAIVQSIAGSFSLIAFITALTGIITKLANFWGLKLPHVYALAAFVTFAIPDFDMITGAKPDGLLLAFAMGSLLLASRAAYISSFSGAAFLGFWLTVPCSLKTTWIISAAALVPSILLALSWKMRRLPNIKWFGGLAFGVGMGILVCLPIFWRNFYFFHNPIHPAQLAFFRSSPWTQTMNDYWISIAQKPESFIQWLSNLLLILREVPTRTFASALPLYCILIVALISMLRVKFLPPQKKALTKPPREKNPTSISFLTFLCSLGTFGIILLWSILYYHGIYSRFLYPLWAPIIVLTLIATSFLLQTKSLAFAVSSEKLMFAAFMLTPLFFGSVEVRVPATLKAWSMNVDEFYRDFSPSLREYGKFKDFNTDLQARSPLKIERTVLLTDNGSGYFYNSEILSFRSYHFDYLLSEYQSESGDYCIWQFANDIGIRYLLASDRPFSDWPIALAPLISNAKPLSDAKQATHRHLWDLDVKKLSEAEAISCKPKRRFQS